MKKANIISTLLDMSSIGLFGLSAVAVPTAVQAGGANYCLIVRTNKYNSQELYNRCNGPVEAAWCHYSDNNCSRFDNTWTIDGGQSYPVARGLML